MTTQTEGERTAVDCLEHAVEDLNLARRKAQEEVRSAIGSAADRAREALEDLKATADERARKERKRAEDRADQWQFTLEEAGEDGRRELGIRAVRTQRSSAALDAMADEIKRCKDQLPLGA